MAEISENKHAEEQLLLAQDEALAAIGEVYYRGIGIKRDFSFVYIDTELLFFFFLNFLCCH